MTNCVYAFDRPLVTRKRLWNTWFLWCIMTEKKKEHDLGDDSKGGLQDKRALFFFFLNHNEPTYPTDLFNEVSLVRHR